MAGKGDVINAIAEQAGITKKEATAAFDAFVGYISDSCQRGDRCAIPGNGCETAERERAKGMPWSGDDLLEQRSFLFLRERRVQQNGVGRVSESRFPRGKFLHREPPKMLACPMREHLDCEPPQRVLIDVLASFFDRFCGDGLQSGRATRLVHQDCDAANRSQAISQ
jgi:DNA-binding protein HU-beta